MRQAHNLVVLLLCLAAIRAEQEQQQRQQEQPPSTQQQPLQQQAFDTPQQHSPALTLSPEELDQARAELHKLLSDLPIQTVEPLVETPRSYCRAFNALCTIACEERLEMTEQPRATSGKDTSSSSSSSLSSPEIASAVCADPNAKTVFNAGAKCECAGLDMTDRVNFALVGGVTSSKAPPHSDFSSEGLLDGLTFLPAIATFVNIIHIAQKVCFYIGFLKVLADDTSGPAPTPMPPAGGGGGGIFDSIKDWFSGLFGGGPAKPPTPPPPAPAPAPAPALLSPPAPSKGDPDGKGDGKPSTGTGTATQPTPTPKKWFFGLFLETDEHGNIIDDVVGGPDQKQRLENDEGDDAYRLVGRDGRVARIVRAQKRQGEKKRSYQEQGKHDL
ncbi:hypothetical protein CPB97_003798 [Podila verticillata]|nr:hypothetical protein CPB97_003798 [Podila verticillata]